MIYEEVLKAEKKLDDCMDWETGEIDDNYELVTSGKYTYNQ